MVSMRDVAAVARVSYKTVSRVHNNDPNVAEATRKRVQDALDQLGYLPNTLATTFRDGRSPVIVVAVPDLGDPYFSAIVRRVDHLAAAQEMLTVVAGIGENPANERVRIEALLSRRVSGLIVAPVGDDQSYLLPWARQTPMVFIDRRPSHLAADSFTTDDDGGGYEVTTHLVGHGHRDIAFLGDSPQVPTSADRLAGYARALARAGLPVRPELVAWDGATRSGAAAAIKRLRDAADPPTAIFSSNARCTIALAPLWHDLGMAVVSFGDFPMSDVLVPSVTVLDQDPARLGELALARLLDRIAHPTRRYRRREVLPATLVERDSCRRPASAGRA